MVKDILKAQCFSKLQRYERCTQDMFLKCQWQMSKRVQASYAAYRLFHAALFLGFLVASMAKFGRPHKEGSSPYKWPIYLTNWGLLLAATQAVFAAALVLRAYLKKYDGLEPSGVPIRRVYRVYCVLHSTAIVIAFGITIMYWAKVYDPAIHSLDAVNIIVHAVNSILMFIDFMLVAHPFKFLHVVYPMGFVLCYIVFNVAYYGFGGTDGTGRHYIYKMLDWRQPWQTILFSVGGYIFLFGLHTIVWILFLIRRHLSFTYKLYVNKKTSTNNGFSDENFEV